MKVIKEGKEIKGKMRVTCPKCEAELEIEACDMKKLPDDGKYPGEYYYICPCCHRTQLISHNKLTEEIRFDIMSK